MDNQEDHGKNHTSGHEGVYICRKCGWPFPNPHPSARHRRAHRKICGTIHGYKYLDSNSTLSDDDHLSDEADHKTPSTLLLQRSFDEKKSAGSGDRTNRSEDDAFVDAVTEFSDSGYGKGLGDSSDDANKRTRSIESTLENQTTTVLSFEDDAISALVPPSNNSPDSSRTTETQGDNLSADALESKSQPSHVTTDRGTEKSGHESIDEKQSSTCDLNPFQFDSRADASQENMKKRAREELAVADVMGNKDQNKKRNAVDDSIDGDSNEIETAHLDRPVVDFTTTDNAMQTSEAVYTSGKTEDVTSEYVAAGEDLDMKKSLDVPSSDVDAIEHANTYFSTSQINVVSATGEMASGKLTEIANEQGEVNDNFHVLSVPADIPVLKNPEIVIGGYKDHKSWRRPQLVDVDSFEVINDVKDSVHQVYPSNSLSSLSDEGEQLFASDSHISQDNIQPEGGKSEPVKDSMRQVIPMNSFSSLSDEGEQLFAIDTQVSGDGTLEGRNRESIVEKFLDEPELGESQVREAVNQGHVTNESCALKDTAAANEVENTTVQSPQEQLADDYNRNLSESKNVLEHGTSSISDTTSVAALEVRQARSNLVGTDDVAADYEINGFDITKCEEVKVIAEDSSGPENLGIFSQGKVESISLEQGMGSISDDKASGDAEVRQASSTIGTDDEISGFDIAKSEAEVKGIAKDSYVKITATPENLDKNGGSDKGENTNGSKIETREGDSSLGSVDGSTLMNTTMTSEIDKDLDDTLVISKDVVNICEINVSEPECLLLNKAASDNQESVLECETDDKAKVHGEDSQVGESDNVGDTDKFHKSVNNAGDVEISQTPSDKIDDFEVLHKPPKEHITKESRLSPSNASVSIQTRATVGDNLVDAAPEDQPGENKLVAQQLGASATELSVDSGSQTDSLEGHWGSVSDGPVISTQSEMQATVDMEGKKGSEAEKEMGKESEKSDVFESPSFMTLVEPRGGDAHAADEEIRRAQKEEPKEGWFPLLTNVVNESQGRKKNEEIIAKVTNWSTPSKQHHAPLKNLLNTENKSKENQTQRDKDDEKEEAAQPTVIAATLKPSATPEMGGIAEPFKKDETAKEWSSPARYPADIKREKRKEKGRPYWAQFMCCSSVN